MVKQFNKSNLPSIRAAMDVALGDVCKKFGVGIRVGSASYRSYETTFKVKLSILDEDGDNRQDKANFELLALIHGFDADDFGKDFTTNGRQFKITGWNPRASKYRVVTREIATEATYYFTPRTVLQAMGKPGKDCFK